MNNRSLIDLVRKFEFSYAAFLKIKCGHNCGLLIRIMKFKKGLTSMTVFLIYFTVESFSVITRLSLSLIPFIERHEQFYLNNNLLLEK